MFSQQPLHLVPGGCGQVLMVGCLPSQHCRQRPCPQRADRSPAGGQTIRGTSSRQMTVVASGFCGHCPVGKHFIKGDPHGDGHPQLLFHRPAAGWPRATGSPQKVEGARHVQPALINAEGLHQVGVAGVDLPGQFGVIPVLVGWWAGRRMRSGHFRRACQMVSAVSPQSLGRLVLGQDDAVAGRGSRTPPQGRCGTGDTATAPPRRKGVQVTVKITWSRPALLSGETGKRGNSAASRRREAGTVWIGSYCSVCTWFQQGRFSQPSPWTRWRETVLVDQEGDQAIDPSLNQVEGNDHRHQQGLHEVPVGCHSSSICNVRGVLKGG